MRRIKRKSEADCQTDIQCTPHILEEGDLAKVQSNQIVQTIASLPAWADDSLIYEQLQHVDPAEIREDCIKIIKYRSQRKLKFLLPDIEDEDVSEVYTEIEDTETSENETLSVESAVETFENMEDKQVMTRLMVFPHFLRPREVAIISCNFATQTDVSCQPQCSLTEIIPKLKSCLNHEGQDIFPGDTRQNRSMLDIIREIIEDVADSHKHMFDADFTAAFTPIELNKLQPVKPKKITSNKDCTVCPEKEPPKKIATREHCEAICNELLNSATHKDKQNTDGVSSKQTSASEKVKDIQPESATGKSEKENVNETTSPLPIEESSAKNSNEQTPKTEDAKEALTESSGVSSKEENSEETSSINTTGIEIHEEHRAKESAAVETEGTQEIPQKALTADREKNPLNLDNLTEEQKLEERIDLEERVITITERGDEISESVDKICGTESLIDNIFQSQVKDPDVWEQIGKKNAACICGGLKIKLYIKDVDDPRKKTHIELNILPGMQKLEVRAIPEVMEDEAFINENECDVTCCATNNYNDNEYESTRIPDGRTTRCPRIITRLNKYRKPITEAAEDISESQNTVTEDDSKLKTVVLSDEIGKGGDISEDNKEKEISVSEENFVEVEPEESNNVESDKSQNFVEDELIGADVISSEGQENHTEVKEDVSHSNDSDPVSEDQIVISKELSNDEKPEQVTENSEVSTADVDNNCIDNGNKKECVCDKDLEKDNFEVEYDEEYYDGAFEFCEKKIIKKRKSRDTLDTKAVSVSNLLDGTIMALVSKSDEGFNIQLNVKNTICSDYDEGYQESNKVCICKLKPVGQPCNCDPNQTSLVCKCGMEKQTEKYSEDRSVEMDNMMISDDEYETCSEGPSTARSRKPPDISVNEPSTTATITLPDKTVLNLKLTVQPNTERSQDKETPMILREILSNFNYPVREGISAISGVLPFRAPKRIDVAKSMESSVISETFLRRVNPYITPSSRTVDILTPSLTSRTSFNSQKYYFVNPEMETRPSAVFFSDYVQYHVRSSEFTNEEEPGCTKETCEYISGEKPNPQNIICACDDKEAVEKQAPCSGATCPFAKLQKPKVTEKQDVVFMTYKACEELFKPIQATLINLRQELKNLNMPEIDCIFNKRDTLESEIPKYTTFQKKMREFDLQNERNNASAFQDYGYAENRKCNYNFPVIKVQLTGSRSRVTQRTNVKIHPKVTFNYVNPESLKTSEVKSCSSHQKNCCSSKKCKRLTSNNAQNSENSLKNHGSKSYKAKIEAKAVFKTPPLSTDSKIYHVKGKCKRISSNNAQNISSHSFVSYDTDDNNGSIPQFENRPESSCSRCFRRKKRYVEHGEVDSSYEDYNYYENQSYDRKMNHSSDAGRKCALYHEQQVYSNGKNSRQKTYEKYDNDRYRTSNYDCCMKHSQSKKNNASFGPKMSACSIQSYDEYESQEPYNKMKTYKQKYYDNNYDNYEIPKYDYRTKYSDSRRLNNQAMSSLESSRSMRQNYQIPKCGQSTFRISTAQYYDSAYHSNSNSPQTNTRCISPYSQHENYASYAEKPTQRTKVKINLNEMRHNTSPIDSDKSVQINSCFRECKRQSSHSLSPNLSGSVGQEEEDWSSLSNVSSRVSSEEFICPNSGPPVCPKTNTSRRGRKRKCSTTSSRGTSSESGKNVDENLSYPFLEALSYFSTPRKKGTSWAEVHDSREEVCRPSTCKRRHK